MNPRRLSEWNASPFGRSLVMLPHRLPRDSRSGRAWELERGFHLEVVDDEVFALTLAPPGPTFEIEVPIGSFLEAAGAERLLLWHCPGRYRRAGLERFAELLRQRGGDEIGLILSRGSEHRAALSDYLPCRSLWKPLRRPVVQVFQDFPDSEFFSVEKNLFDLGRIGRRLVKLGRWRRLMPW